MKQILILLSICLLFSCKKTDENADASCEKKELEMYQMSEMALLMEQMYAENERLKEKINKGEAIGEFPEYYNKLFTAKFTDESDNDDFFKEKAQKYIDTQKLIYQEGGDLKEKYNAGVESCVACHLNKCGGPIPKIKKLYLK